MIYLYGMPQPVLGKRVRYHRKRAGLTLEALGASIGRPASYLSQLENGLTTPQDEAIECLANALGCALADLTDPTPPTPRDALEIAVLQNQDDPSYCELGLAHLKPSASMPDQWLEHLVAVYEALKAAEATAAVRPGDDHRQAHNALRQHMRERNNYFADIEREATRVLSKVGYSGGPITERYLTDVVEYFGFGIVRTQGLPDSTRSITDLRNRRIYIPQRNELESAAARSVVLQALGSFVLGHRDSDDVADYLRQRVESNYFAGAVLSPERQAVQALRDAYERQDLSVDDFRQTFYISYEMAAHRLTNLVTEHLDLTLHFIRADQEGVVWKAYENDDIPISTDADGTVEGQRVCRHWGTRQAFTSTEAYDVHYQWTETDRGDYWCATYVEPERSPALSVTIGTDADQAHYFRGSDTGRRSRSNCPSAVCCRQPKTDQRQRWRGAARPSARDRSQFLSGLPAERPAFSTFPGVDMVEVFDFLDRHA